MKKTVYNQKESIHLKEVAERFSQAYNQHDVDAIGKFYAQDANYYVSGEPESIRGREAIKENIQSLIRAFPDVKTEFINIFTTEGHFISEGISRGTHSGPMATPEGDVPPTGRSGSCTDVKAAPSRYHRRRICRSHPAGTRFDWSFRQRSCCDVPSVEKLR